MNILTPYGYKDINDVNIGDELCAFDAITSEPIINTLLKKELWSPDMDGDVEGFFENHGIFRSYLINGTYKLFKNQGVWTYLDGEMYVNVAKLLKVGDIIFSDEDQDIEITSIEEIFEPTWWRLEVSGDRTYIADGLTLHNASRYWVNTGTNTNWNSSPTTNWSATSGSATKAAIPTSTDDVTFDGAGSGNSASVISATITILSFTVTSGYTATMTHDAVLTVAGNITLHNGYTIAGTSNLSISASSTILTGGKIWPNSVTLSNTTGLTYTINTNTFEITGTLTIGTGATTTFAGDSGFTCGTLVNSSTGATTVTLKEAVTYTVRSSLNCNTTRVGSILTFTSSHASTKAILTLREGATCACLCNFTRIDASGGRPIRAFNSTVTDCINVQSFFDLKTVTA